MFFVISGYCIAERCTREYCTSGTVMSFLVDRLLRIYPPYWAALIFALLLNVAGAVAHHPSIAMNQTLPAGLHGWLSAFGAVELWFGHESYLLVAWTLSFEIGFYLIAACCLGLALLAKRPWAGWMLGAALFVIALSSKIAWLPLLELWPNFALGSLVWLLVRLIPRLGMRLTLGLVLFTGLGLITWKAMPYANYTQLLMTGYALLLLLLQPWDTWLAESAPLRWLGWIGTFSYSLYLVHAPLVGKFRNLLGRRWPVADPHSLWVPTFACGIAIFTAWCFYNLVERRTEIFRRKYLSHSGAPNLS
jgi:peptidoglycan/LPS O-acetylase OafA/YrhL